MTTPRLVVMVGLTLALLSFPVATEAQPASKKVHIGVLLLPPRAGAGGAYIRALREGLHELGYVEGQNLLLRSGRRKGGRMFCPGSLQSF